MQPKAIDSLGRRRSRPHGRGPEARASRGARAAESDDRGSADHPRSPTDAQPAFETIAASATRLCDGLYSVVFRFDGEMITVAADSCASPQTSAIHPERYPAPPGRGTLASRALLERRVIT